jgi:DNA-binding MarR family transcriptional regulator
MMFEGHKFYPPNFSTGPVRGIAGRSEDTEIPHVLLRIAMRLNALRESRVEFFSADMFGEAAWDMLLALYIAQGRGYTMKVSDVCAESRCPQTTALRWLKYLEDEGLAAKRPNPFHNGSSMVEITAAGAERLNRYLARANQIFAS